MGLSIKGLGRGLTKVGKALGKVAQGVVRQAIGTLPVLSAVATGVSTFNRPRAGNLPPGFAPVGGQGGQVPIPRPREGAIGRTVSRILPGGMTGREFTPVNDMVDKIGRPIAVYPEQVTQTRGPKGYVVVNYNGQAIAMLRTVAIRAGLYTAPPKPPISGSDMRAIQRAHQARKRVKTLAGKVGFKVAARAFK